MPAKLTRQDKLDICKSYREAKNKDAQIGIMSDLYLVTREEIRQILMDGGEIKKPRTRREPVKPKQEAAKEQPKPADEKSRPGRIMQEMISQARDLLKTTEEEIEKLQRELREAEQEAKAIRDTIAEVRADLSFLDYLRKAIPADQMDKYLYGYEKEAGHEGSAVDRNRS